MEEIRIITDRHTLFPLTLSHLKLYLYNPQKLNRLIGKSVSRNILTEQLRRAIKMKIAKITETTVEEHIWLTYWLIEINEHEYGAGMAGFKGVPNQAGEVEIGYGIDPAYQGKGYMTEAVRALIIWAFEFDKCLSVIAPDTKKENIPSNRVLEKVGMFVYAQSEDTISWRIDSDSVKYNQRR